jgi:aerobic carbon-monoxide dehydrogenase medium subunit
MKLVDFRIPKSLDETRSVLKQLGAGAVALAGGTSFVFTPGPDEKVGVDITRLGLDGIRRENGAFRIGATTRVAAVQKYWEDGWVLNGVARHLSSQQIRNMSTLGGNIVRVFPWADFPVALLALGAEMVIAGDGGERVVGVDEFFTGQPARLLKPGELLVEVRVRHLPPRTGFGYRKDTRTALGFSSMTAAAVIEADGPKVKSACVTLGAGIPFPARLRAVETYIAGERASPQLFAAATRKAAVGLRVRSAPGISDEFTVHLATVAVGDVLAEAWARAMH